MGICIPKKGIVEQHPCFPGRMSSQVSQVVSREATDFVAGILSLLNKAVFGHGEFTGKGKWNGVGKTLDESTTH